jgi:hypothetical protein
MRGVFAVPDGALSRWIMMPQRMVMAWISDIENAPASAKVRKGREFSLAAGLSVSKITVSGLLAVAAGLIAAPAAHAARLQVAPDSPAWMHVGADVLLWAHIGGGAAGIVTGMIALASRKGGRIHRSAGKAFFAVMLMSYGVAAMVAPFMHVEQRMNTMAGLVALYLLVSGWATVQQKETTAGPWVVGGLVAALALAGAGAMFTLTGAGVSIGPNEGAADPVFMAFAVVGLIAAAGEINVLARRTLSRPARLARHLWRMCLSLFIASGSFFFGQPRFQPEWLMETRLNLVFALTPLVLMLVYLVLVRIPKRRRKLAAAAQEA